MHSQLQDRSERSDCAQNLCIGSEQIDSIGEGYGANRGRYVMIRSLGVEKAPCGIQLKQSLPVIDLHSVGYSIYNGSTAAWGPHMGAIEAGYLA